MATFELPKLDKKVIQSMKKHLETGYYTDKTKVNEVIQAIELGKISLTRMEDDHSTFSDLAGDCFNPEINTDMRPCDLKRQENNFRSRISKSGVWTMIAQYWTGREWEWLEGVNHNTISGFVGNDFFGSGYEWQVMEAAMDAYNKQDLDKDGFVIDPYQRAA